ncbi:MAG TPA: carbohydrate kinase [Candidatus Angelobacter sp.]|nr:carbohydrate kinase [Candidatus Angelobacter sp.]
MRIVSVGEILWDVIGENEYLGGAPLNFAAHAQKLGHEVFPLSGVGADARGQKALDMLKARGMSTEFVQVLKDRPTGTAEVELDMEGKPTFRIVRSVAYDFVDLTEAELKRIAKLKPDWIYLGTLYHMSPNSLASTMKLLKAVPNARRFYDVNLREGHWSLATIEQLAAVATVTKLSDSEAESLDASVDASEGPGDSIESFCRRWCSRFGTSTMCVTFGERGCAILKGGRFSQTPGFRVTVADTVGAGDAFSAAFVHGLSQGWPARRIAECANAVGALVASRSGAMPDWAIAEAHALIKAQAQ